MYEEIPEADIGDRQTEHYAVCLKYDEAQNDAPVCVAKGVDYMAQKIKDIAREHDVMIVENKPLARALYAATDLAKLFRRNFQGGSGNSRLCLPRAAQDLIVKLEV